MSALAERVLFRAHFRNQQLKLIESIIGYQVGQAIGQHRVARANAAAAASAVWPCVSDSAAGSA